jgi:hypothetical protein
MTDEMDHMIGKEWKRKVKEERRRMKEYQIGI